MANHKDAEKRARQAEVRRVRNHAVKSALRTHTKRFLNGLGSEGREQAEQELRAVSRLWDRAASKKVIHANTAARRKSRLCLAFQKAYASAS